MLASVALLACLVLAPQVKALAPDPFIGTWFGDRRKTSLSRVVIAKTHAGYEAHIWAFSTFEEIDWGKRQLQTYASDISSKRANCGVTHWNTEFADEMVILRPNGNTISVESFTRFKDGSGRSDFHSIESLLRRRSGSVGQL